MASSAPALGLILLEAPNEVIDQPLVADGQHGAKLMGLAAYQHPKPAPMYVAVDGYEEPKTVEEARTLILKLGARLARGEISVAAHDALVNGIKVYLGDKAAEQERILARLETSLRSGESS